MLFFLTLRRPIAAGCYKKGNMTEDKIFISLRFSESLPETTVLKNELLQRGISCFLCYETPGACLAKIISQKLRRCELAVIMER